MHYELPFVRLRSLPLAGALLALASACTTGVNVGNDATGGSGTAGGGASGAGGGLLGNPACRDPAALQCAWGQYRGPCGGPRPNALPCAGDAICAGGSAEKEGTCISPGDVLLHAGDSCGLPTDPSNGVCPWDSRCNEVPPFTCSLNECTLEPGDSIVSSSFITIDGDGPTQTYGFACTDSWASQLTGQASAFTTKEGTVTMTPVLDMEACPSSVVTWGGASISLRVPLVTTGTVTGGFLDYTLPTPTTDGVSQYESDVPGGSNTPPMVTVTALTDAAVIGSYDGIVSASGVEGVPPLHLSGTFSVCRLPFHADPGL